MNDSEKAALIESFIAAYISFDIDGMVLLLSPGVRFENRSGDELTVTTTGIDEFRKLAEQSKGMFTEREQRIQALEFKDGAAIVSIAYTGRLAVDLPDGPSAGTLLELDGTSEYFFADGKITKIVDRSS